MLKLLILIFHRSLEPVLRVKVHNDAALIEAVVAVSEIGLYDKREVFIIGFHLENRSIIIAEMIIGPLPEIGMRLSHYLDKIIIYAILLRFSGPFQFIYHCFFSLIQTFYNIGLSGFHYMLRHLYPSIFASQQIQILHTNCDLFTYNYNIYLADFQSIYATTGAALKELLPLLSN